MSQLHDAMRKLKDEEELAIFWVNTWGRSDYDPDGVISLYHIRRDDPPARRLRPAVCQVPPQCLLFQAFDMNSMHNLSHILVRQEYAKGLTIINEFSKRPRDVISRHFSTEEEAEDFIPTEFQFPFTMYDQGEVDDRAGGVSVVGQPGIGTPQFIYHRFLFADRVT